VDGRTDGRAGEGRAAGTGGRRRVQTGWLQAGIGGSGGGGQAKIAISRQRRDLRGRADGRADKAIPPQICIFSLCLKLFSDRLYITHVWLQTVSSDKIWRDKKCSLTFNTSRLRSVFSTVKSHVVLIDAWTQAVKHNHSVLPAISCDKQHSTVFYPTR